MRILVVPAFSVLLVSCQSGGERTVLYGPKQIDTGINDYNPQREAAERAAVLSGSKRYSSGSQFGGGSGWGVLFGTGDRYGVYGEKGVNPMSEKMHGATLRVQEEKTFEQTKSFLTKRYATDKEFGTKSTLAGRFRSFLSGKKAPAVEKLAVEHNRASGVSMHGIPENETLDNGRAAATREFSGGGREAVTRDYYPAAKGRESAPTVNTLSGRESPATEEDVRRMLGKE